MEKPLAVLFAMVGWISATTGAVSGTVAGRSFSVGPEQPVSTPQLAPAPESQWRPVVASNSAEFLAVWEDYRIPESQFHIFATRVDHTGHPLDPTGILIAHQAFSEIHPAVASDGSGFFVAWTSHDAGHQDLFGMRMGADGTLLDAQPLLLAQQARATTPPTMAFGGGEYLLVWDSDGAGFNGLLGLRIDPSGQPIDAAPFAISPSAASSPSVAWNGHDFLVVWSHETSPGEIYGARVSPGGIVLDPEATDISNSPRNDLFPSVAAAGDLFLVAWRQGPVGATMRMCSVPAWGRTEACWILPAVSPSRRPMLARAHQRSGQAVEASSWCGRRRRHTWTTFGD